MIRFLRSPASILTAAVFLVAAFHPGPARTEGESLLWTARTNGGMVSLSYGSLDPKQNPLFMLTCLNELNVTVLEVFSIVEGKAPGQTLTIGLAAGDKKASLEGRVELDDKSHAMFAEANEVEPDPVLEVLKAKGDLTVSLGVTQKTLGDAGREQAVAQFSKDCEMITR